MSKRYEGSIMGLDYRIDKNDDTEFEEWLEAKLLRYKFKPIELKILRKILGITNIEARLTILETK